jgi:radical SAM superfamily enzyme YgiQ (UPF0313 family)
MSERRLLLVNPIQWLEGRRQRGWNGHRFVPPLNLAYVAALTPDNWTIRLVDENAGHDATQIAGFAPDLVGISSYTATTPRAYQLAGHFREQGVPVVIGGSHASALPHEVARYANVAFVGQAEGAWPQLVDDFEHGRLRHIYDGGTPPLDRLPLPRRDLYPHRYRFATVLTSKGCPYRCEFCSVWKMYRQHYYMRPVNQVLDELAQIEAGYIFFVDDNLTVNSRRTIELCRGMVEQGLDKHFAIQASLEVGQDEELLGWLRRAGCFLVFVGIESVDECTLQHIRKASNLKVGVSHYQEMIARIQAHGMAVSAGIIFGNDNDTLETFRELETFVAKSGIDSPVYTILTPLPGTDLWARLEAEGRLRMDGLPESYTYCDAHHVTFEPLRVTADELLAANREVARRATTVPALVRGTWQTWRRTGSLLAALASFQNNRWVCINAGSSMQARVNGHGRMGGSPGEPDHER